jgi:hypothetical protein
VLLFSAFKMARPSEQEKSIGTVRKMTGKYVFIFTEPAQPYEVAFEVKATVMNFLTCPTISEMANAVVSTALIQSKKENIPFDAVVIGDGRKDIGIKFKE